MDYISAILYAYPQVHIAAFPEANGVVFSTHNAETVITYWPYDTVPTKEDVEKATLEWEAGALGRAKKEAIAEANRQAGEARSRVGTNIPFQGDVYQLKGEEAFAFASDPEPNQYKYPLLYAEAQARGMELSTLVAEYAYNAVMWPRILAAIEAVRMKMRVMIEAAATIAEVEAILAGVVWPV